MQGQRVLGAILLIVGIVALVVGVIYLTVQAHSLPSILGTLHGYSGHRSKRGVAALIVGAVLVVAGAVFVWKPKPQT